ncbi:MAG: hypothetical protein D6790_12010, partial [Caldilineae bacterium]
MTPSPADPRLAISRSSDQGPGLRAGDLLSFRPQTHRERRIVERARALAEGLRTFTPPEHTPEELRETAYLLQEAANLNRPVLERLRILGLMAATLDQFCVDSAQAWTTPLQEARVSGSASPARVQPPLQVAVYAGDVLRRAAALFRDQILPGLSQEANVFLPHPATLAREERVWLRAFFQEQVYPLLTPLAVDPGHPFPFISSFSMNFLVELRGAVPARGRPSVMYARIKAPRLLPRFIRLPASSERGDPVEEKRFLWSEDVMHFFLAELFPGMRVQSAHLFRVLRATPVPLDAIQWNDGRRTLHHRHLAAPVVRLDV